MNDLAVKFQEKLEKVSGECYRVAKIPEVGDLVIKVLKSKNVSTVAFYDSAIAEAANLRDKLGEAGFEIHTDNFLAATAQDDLGITAANWGIAELGTLVQIAPEVDHRLCSSMVPIHLALLQTSNIVPDLDDMLEILSNSPEMPGFIGFITGPSRSSDIECTLEIGVHGPKQLIVILIDD